MTTLNIKKLPAVLKIIRGSGLTGVLLVRYNELGGALVFREGRLVHAQIGPGPNKQEGDRAVYTLLSWEQGQLKWRGGLADTPFTIDDHQEENFYEAVEYMTGFGALEPADGLEEELPEFFGISTAEAPAPPAKQSAPVASPLQTIVPVEPSAIIRPPGSRRPPAPPANPEPVIEPFPAAPAQFKHPALVPAITGVGPAVSTLIKMGVPRLISHEQYSLNSHFANSVHVAREVAERFWPKVVQAAQLTQFLYDDPEVNEDRTTPVDYLSRLNYGFEQVFESIAPEKIRQWGRQATERSLSLRKSSSREQSIMRLIPGKHRKLNILLNSFTRTMDDIRGEHLHTWKQIDQNQFWLVHFNNLYALGRRRKRNSCYVWTSTFSTMLNWAYLGEDWVVEEIECGCVTGTYDCVFAIRMLGK